MDIARSARLPEEQYLAFSEGKHLMVILTDLTTDCEALREVSRKREKGPFRHGFS